MSLALIVGLAVGVLVGAIALLRKVAPLTKTDKDDKALATLEKIDAVVEPLADKIAK